MAWVKWGLGILGYVLALGALVLPVSSVSAQMISSNTKCKKPIDVGGDKLEVVGNVATLTGDVRVVQCEAVLSTIKLIGIQHEDSGDYKSLEAIGSVTYSNGKEAIASDEAFYDITAGTILFRKNVVVTQGDQVMTGGALTYWPDTGRILFVAPVGERVRGLIHTARNQPAS